MSDDRPRLNAEWHKANRMPPKATLDQRVEWHIAHTAVCACRELSPEMAAEIEKRRRANPEPELSPTQGPDR